MPAEILKGWENVPGVIQLRNLSGGNTAVCPSVVSGVVGGCHCVYWVHN